jgi:hypothetical protein
MMNEAMDTMTATTAKVHVFERRGLGLAPFRFVGMKENWFVAAPGVPKKPGSSCDYCGTAIAFECWVSSSDGKRFKVGNECINKSGDSGLRRAVAPAVKKINNVKADARIAVAIASLDSARSALEALPHPYLFMAAKGHTALSFVEYNLKFGGRSGKTKAARMIERALEN